MLPSALKSFRSALELIPSTIVGIIFPHYSEISAPTSYQSVPSRILEIPSSATYLLSQIPPHGRWRHLDAGRPRVEPLIAKWKSSSNPPDTKEICRRLIDLFLVSVLLDAGAGNAWTYAESQSGQSFSRSEGLGVASFNMFEQGFFSGDSENPFQVDGKFCQPVYPSVSDLKPIPILGSGWPCS